MTASPDLSRIIDLRPFDLDPWDIAARAVTELSRALGSSYDPLVADVDVTLIDGLAIEVMDLVVAANRSVYSSVHGILNSFGVPWFEGAKATTTLKFTGVNGTVIPIGMEAQVRLSDGRALLFATTATGTITGGLVTLAAQCTSNASVANRLTINTPLVPAVGSASLDAITIASAVIGGQDPEPLSDYYVRVGNRLGRITDSLVMPEHFASAALEQPFVVRAKGIDEWDGVTFSTAGSDVNHVTVAVAGVNGAALTAPQKLTLKNDLMKRSVTALATHIVDAVVVPIQVVATLRRKAGYTDMEVHDYAVAALQAFLSPDTADWGATIEPNDIIELLGRDVIGADVVVGSIIPADPIVLAANQLPIYDVSTSTITITTP